MDQQLSNQKLWYIARDILQLGPRDHGENKNRWGSITAAVKAACEELEIKMRYNAPDRKLVWDMVKYLRDRKEAA